MSEEHTFSELALRIDELLDEAEQLAVEGGIDFVAHLIEVTRTGLQRETELYRSRVLEPETTPASDKKSGEAANDV